MILKLLCAPLVLLINAIIGLLPVFETINSTVAGLIEMFSIALQFFPADVWILALGSIVFWLSIRVTFAIVFFILDIIVGVIP